MTQGAQRSVAGQVIIEIIAVVLSLAVATGLSVLVVGLQINDARASAAQAQSEAQAGDLPGLIDSVEALRSNVAAVATYTKSPSWLITQYIPGVGEPVHTASTLTNGANNVAAASTGFLDLARQLDRTRSTSGGQLVPAEVLTNLAPAANELASALTAFTADVDSLTVGAAYGPFQGRRALRCRKPRPASAADAPSEDIAVDRRAARSERPTEVVCCIAKRWRVPRYGWPVG